MIDFTSFLIDLALDQIHEYVCGKVLAVEKQASNEHTDVYVEVEEFL